MSKLAILAIVVAKEGHSPYVRTEIDKIIPLTRAEKGCVQYDLLVDNNKPARFILQEIWDTYELWRDHLNSPHMAAYHKATEKVILSKEIYEMTKLK